MIIHFISKIFLYGNYTIAQFATQLSTLINDSDFVISYDEDLFTINISNRSSNKAIAILTNYSIGVINSLFSEETSIYHGKSWNITGNIPFEPNNLCSINEILGLTEREILQVAEGEDVSSPPLKLHIINNVYITSPTLGNYNTICPFSNNVIKKVPVTVAYGYMIVDQYMSSVTII
jgi:hypothetical protein